MKIFPGNRGRPVGYQRMNAGVGGWDKAISQEREE